MKLYSVAENYEKIMKKIKNKFILTEKEAKVLEFFIPFSCNVCGVYPTIERKSHKVGKGIYCEDCWKKEKEFASANKGESQ